LGCIASCLFISDLFCRTDLIEHLPLNKK
jgi:hypothetical protein